MKKGYVIFAENYKGQPAFIDHLFYDSLTFDTTTKIDKAYWWADWDWDNANQIYQTFCPCEFELLPYSTALDRITPKLYEVYLGGEPPKDSIVEPHELVWVVAFTEKQAKQKAKLKWLGHSKVHIDGIKQLSIIDGYNINLTKVSENEPWHEVKVNTNWKSLND